MSTRTSESPAGRLLHRPVDTGLAYWGPGDRYTFLVTGEESAGAYFAMEASVPPGGGPPPHIHSRENETFYLIEGAIEFLLGDKTLTAGPGDFVNVPRGAMHCFHNTGTKSARMVVTFTPAGIERFFEETLEHAENDVLQPPDNVNEVAARFLAAAPQFGLTFV
jgi:quercetin dioxygenase-like cupin family protein